MLQNRPSLLRTRVSVALHSLAGVFLTVLEAVLTVCFYAGVGFMLREIVSTIHGKPIVSVPVYLGLTAAVLAAKDLGEMCRKARLQCSQLLETTWREEHILVLRRYLGQ